MPDAGRLFRAGERVAGCRRGACALDGESALGRFPRWPGIPVHGGHGGGRLPGLHRQGHPHLGGAPAQELPQLFSQRQPPSPQGAFAEAATLFQEGHADAAGIKSIQPLFEPRGPSSDKLQQKLLHARKQPLFERLRDSAPTVFIRNLMISQRQAGAGAFLTCANAYRDARLRICNAFFALSTRFYISLPVTDLFSGNLRFIHNAGQKMLLRCIDCDSPANPKAVGGRVRKPGVLIRGNDGVHAESCAAGEAVGQRSSRSVDFTDAVYHSVYGGSPAFPEHRQLPDGSRVQVRFEPNLVAWGAQRLCQ